MAQSKRIDEIEAREARRQRKEKERALRKKALLIISVIIVILALLIVGALVLLLRARMNADIYGTPVESSAEMEIEYVGEKTVTEERATIIEEELEPVKDVPHIITDGLVSKNAYMYRPEDESVVLELDADAHIYPASMTKMMTGLIAIENLDMSLQHTFMQEEVDQAYVQDLTMAGFAAGETVPMMDVLYGAMLPSGAECCYALASEVTQLQWGYEDIFVSMMNEKAKELGMTNTNFTNCTGVQDENHYSSCRDMAILLEHALKNETFRKVISSHTYTTSPTPYHEQGLNLASTLFASIGNSVLDNDVSILGGKTGFTDEAGHCLASFAEMDDETEYILVTAGAFSEVNDYTNISDAKYVYGQLPPESTYTIPTSAFPENQAAEEPASEETASEESAPEEQAAEEPAPEEQNPEETASE